MTFSGVEQRVLSAVWSAGRRKEAATREELDGQYQYLTQSSRISQFTAQPDDWDDAIASLVAKGTLVCKDETFCLSEQGRTYARTFAKAFAGQWFGRWMILSDQSPTYHTFCQRLYGTELCQFGMLTASQLGRLLQVLDLDTHDRVLDLGCGIGTITEHIADVTQAIVTGVDFAVEAIECARERTKRKRGRLTFEVSDMDDLAFSSDSFDAIISIDTLYFVEDSSRTMRRLKEILAPGGRMGLFWTQSAKPPEPEELLQPTETKLAKVLDEAELHYEFWDYTEEERDFWRRFLALANELKPDFETEGHPELADCQISEGQEMVALVEAGRIARYFYHVSSL